MRYYVVSDVHGYYTELTKALKDAGFFSDTVPHKLIVCGDMMDRGSKAREMEEFMLELLNKDELIFIRGNHEDLMVDMLDNFYEDSYEIYGGRSHHVSNGTFDTAIQLSQMHGWEIFDDPDLFLAKMKHTPFLSKLIPASVDFYETENHIFVHGWIPCDTNNMPSYYRRGRYYNFNPDWRSSGSMGWYAARWFNGMELAMLHDIVEPNKTIVCGHWHASYGHSNFGCKCTEFGRDAIFTPFKNRGILAVDACTAHTGFVNCVVIEDEPINAERR